MPSICSALTFDHWHLLFNILFCFCILALTDVWTTVWHEPSFNLRLPVGWKFFTHRHTHSSVGDIIFLKVASLQICIIILRQPLWTPSNWKKNKKPSLDIVMFYPLANDNVHALNPTSVTFFNLWDFFPQSQNSRLILMTSTIILKNKGFSQFASFSTQPDGFVIVIRNAKFNENVLLDFMFLVLTF